ncbi:MAG: hypothetical protein NC348_11125 [Clostridium sp.]|nr:hypothetical protein [Clostridium sp.]
MTLLITVFAAAISTAIWYKKAPEDDMQTGTLCLMYWGASLMWMIDAVFEYAEQRAEFFAPAAADMLNDAFLGFSAVALGLVIWLVTLFVKDPKGVVRQALLGK